MRHRLLADPVLAALAARLGATPAQIALAWLLDLAPNILLIPGTRTRAHLAENLGAADVRLDDAARAELYRHLAAGWRVGTANLRHFDRIAGLGVLTVTLDRAASPGPTHSPMIGPCRRPQSLD